MINVFVNVNDVFQIIGITANLADATKIRIPINYDNFTISENILSGMNN